MSSRFRSAWGHPPMCGFLAIIAATTLLACSGGTEPTATPLAPAVGLSISPTSLSLIVGGEARLGARAFNAIGETAIASFEWSSADPAIATVRKSDGTVTAISVGATTVTATAGALSATASVSVRPSDAANVSVSALALTLIAGEVERLTAYAVDSANRTTSASFEWSSADPAVATVGKTDGIVTAISLGTTTVTVAAGALRATATVSVLPTAGSLSGTFAFTRVTWSSAGGITFDVLTFSGADRTPQSLARLAPFASIAAPAWSTDGTLLAVEVIHAYFPDDYGDYNSDLYVLDAGSPAKAPWRALTADGLSRSPSWSPDGKRIAYLQQTALFSNYNHIHIIDAAGGEPVDLTRPEGQYGAPRWSPDGTRLAFSSAVGENSEIFIVNADGSGMTNVTRSSAFDYDPSWSPDGARLTFVSNRDGSADNVFVVDADGSNVRRLPSLSSYCWGLACSPDGRQIIFSSGGALLVKNADGSSLARLIKTPQNSWDSAPVWRR